MDAQTTEPIVLTQAQIDFYHEQGYLSLPAITSAEEIDWLREIYDRLFASRAGRENGDQFDLGGTDEEGKPATLPQILNPPRYAPELKTARFRANAEAIARQLLGPEARHQGEHAIFKPPFSGAPTPWHQDEAYWGAEYEHNAMSFWIPLQPATLENGCMQFIPGSHRLPVQPHHSIGHDPRVHGLEVDEVDASGAVACPLPAGGCTIHHNRTFHYAGPNRSAIPRRAYISGFGLPPRRLEVARDFYWNRMKITAREERAKAVANQNPAKA
ncbi:MAG TPA: phytanoyl-CoA dioxygenase family protein [Tepidisphaeraceae bacterium]|jgi:ectoine hydroxylase-related dioxygenase (phytanoyl-CoA dioxygenase family)|nr:phytanoyl-CoA dioxygenase family protein [Tepidisphaeraceae bacterium]